VFEKEQIINICQLQMLLDNPVTRESAPRLQLWVHDASDRFKEKQPIQLGEFSFDKQCCVSLFNANELAKFFPDRLYNPRDRERIVEDIRQRSQSALIRSGYLPPENIEELGWKLSDYDDVIVGLDTNVIFDCIVTTYLLDTCVGKSAQDYMDTPTWITLVISKICMGEIERQANYGRRSLTKQTGQPFLSGRAFAPFRR